MTFLDDIDGDGKAAIIFGHLPAKYEEYYDDLLPEVDHLNVIYDTIVWRDIKKFLLDVHFYQAVHFGSLKRVTETGGRFFKESREKYRLDDEFKPNFEIHPVEVEPTNIEHLHFEEAAETIEIDRSQKEYEILLRNQREGRLYKNLIVK